MDETYELHYVWSYCGLNVSVSNWAQLDCVCAAQTDRQNLEFQMYNLGQWLH